jgi:hypothetical protein
MFKASSRHRSLFAVFNEGIIMSSTTTLRCDACGKEFAPTQEYLSQYAGMTTQCECGAAMVVPRPAPGGENIGGWKDGKFVVAEKGLKLPRRCLKCGEPVKTQMTAVVLEWLPGAKNELGSTLLGWARGSLFPVDIFGFVGSSIAATETQAIVVRFGWCPAHRARLNKWWLAGGFCLLGIASLLPMALRWVDGAAAMIALMCGLIVSMVGMIVALQLGPPIRIVHFENNRAWIAGFGEPYVNSLPPLSEAPPAG